MNFPFLLENDKGVVFCVRVSPKSSASRITGVKENELKIALHAPPADGQANLELVRLLSKILSHPKSQIRIIAGETSRSKRVLITGVEMKHVQNALKSFIEPS
ncbi:MAG: YggU family protein [Candidatus Omnitrophota bacterium]|jgi:uncharacterized protein (TIGR00251 family)|nr:MAG: YggU family protein [Candidatus Omnitrophota bacterium]